MKLMVREIVKDCGTTWKGYSDGDCIAERETEKGAVMALAVAFMTRPSEIEVIRASKGETTC